MDLPPPPELPATLDIDHYGYPIQDSGGDNFSENGMTSSSTADTIVEVIRNEEGEEIDPTLGETQKYIMQVPAPGLTEQEMEMHKSLMKHEDAGGDDSDNELKTINDLAARKISSPIPPTTKRKEHDPLRQQEKKAPLPSPAEKIKINIPRKSLKGRQPEDFYQSMSNQMPPQTRQNRSNSNYSSSEYDNGEDIDIIEQNPEYKDKAPKAPVVHRRTSIEWEAFDQSV
uniref:Uncharacterized protein n=1 Tax=Panagrolaimus sp. PS1159 TaxID=55785 RepID=A0AC35FWD1_9BILA